MPREDPISSGEVSADRRPLVVLRAEQDALGDANADCDLVHQVLNESGERCRGTSRHHLDLIRRPEVPDVADLALLVLLLLTVRQSRGRIRREQITAVRGATVREDQRGLLRGEPDARFLGFEDLVQHSRGTDRGVKVRDAPVLVSPERVEVVDEVGGGDVLWVGVLPLARDAENPVRDWPAVLVGDHALKVVLWLGSDTERVANSRAADQLDLKLAINAPNRKAAVAVYGAILGCKLDKLLERVTPGEIAIAAPVVKVLRNNPVVVTIPRRRAVLMRGKVVAELAGNLASLGEVLDQITRLPHHDDAIPHRRARLARVAVLLRRVKPIGLRCVVREQRRLYARLKTLQAPRRRNGCDGAIQPRGGVDDFACVERVHDQFPLKLTKVTSVVAPDW